MKFNFKTILFAFAALASVACNKAAIDDLTGVYSAPVEATLAKLDGEVAIDKQGGFRYITVTLAGTDKLVAKFASAEYFLKPTTYTLASESNIKAGMYSAEGSSFNGKPIILGSLIVDLEGESDYTISGVIMTGANERHKIHWSGKIVFEPDLEVEADYLYVKSVEETESALKHTLVLTKDGELRGQLQFFTALGSSSIEGTYQCQAYASEPGLFCDGFDLTAMLGFPFVGGSYLYIDGAFTPINAGETVTISLDAATGFYKVECSGAAGAFTMDKDVTYYDMEMSSTTEGITEEDGSTPVSGMDRYTIELREGENLVAGFDLVVASGSSIVGEYTVKGYPHEDHVAGNGWGFAPWYFAGCRFVENGEVIYVNPGSKVVVAENDKGYLFTFEGEFQSSADGSTPYTGKVSFGGKKN